MRPFKKMTKEESLAFFERMARAEEEVSDYLFATYGRILLAWSGPPPMKRKGWWWRLPLVKVKWFFKNLFYNEKRDLANKQRRKKNTTE